MVDLIDRAELIENLNHFAPEHYSALVNMIITKQPAVDAVPVVRCKDCVRCGFCGDATNLEIMGFYGFCSRGKRRHSDE